MLVVKQISNEWEVREDRLKPYWDYSATVLLSFTQRRFVHLPREENQMADALATLASMWEIEKQAEMKSLILVRSRTPYYEEIKIMPINPVEKQWFYDQHYLET